MDNTNVENLQQRIKELEKLLNEIQSERDYHLETVIRLIQVLNDRESI